MTPKNRRELRATVQPFAATVVTLAQDARARDHAIGTIIEHVHRLESLTFFDRLRWMVTGRLPAIGSAAALFAEPTTEEAAQVGAFQEQHP